ncbi:retropepsin-like aspartic protease, partial [Klebsiella pneumoniae]|uniref:retropepsin-like aspartic protease n=1 Tax=Klebsiella pneumoniae TaxID=573 RepID=UPI0040559276
MNKEETSALLDTGATKNAISSQFLEKLKVAPRATYPCDILVTVGNNEKIPVSKLVKLNLKIGRLSWPQEFLVIPDLAFEVILGIELT